MTQKCKTTLKIYSVAPLSAPVFPLSSALWPPSSTLAQHTVAAGEVPKTVVEARRSFHQKCGSLCCQWVRRPGGVGHRHNLDRAWNGLGGALGAVVAASTIEARPRGGARGAGLAGGAGGVAENPSFAGSRVSDFQRPAPIPPLRETILEKFSNIIMFFFTN